MIKKKPLVTKPTFEKSVSCFHQDFLIRFFCSENSNRVNIPIVLISMTNKIWKVYIWISLVLLTFFLSIFPKSIVIKENMSYSKLIPANTDLDAKIIRLSVNMFRTLLFFITSDCILAVDFPYFLMQKAKTHEFGVSLMDIGVGYFIICHAMRLIRNMNTEPETGKVIISRICLNVLNTLKNSSILFILGFVRYASLKLLGYSVNVFSSFFDIFIKNSAQRAFFLSILIGCFYQWILAYKTDYLLEYYGQRKTFVDKNKEGLYSTIGYTSMYFLSESVCYHLKKVLNTKENPGRLMHSVSIRCGVFLIIYSILFFVLTHLSSFFIQDISRRICNLSFIFHTEHNIYCIYYLHKHKWEIYLHKLEKEFSMPRILIKSDLCKIKKKKYIKKNKISSSLEWSLTFFLALSLVVLIIKIEREQKSDLFQDKQKEIIILFIFGYSCANK
ncbi:transferring acyl groups [Brachionus plicatilis]|uniref:Phosphatidylinositol-glycan biosynthesis class W protein n=1 Tax=Brachionus plicatilis TaxID=10195 RepID=A0A3M7S255_BRAPC|nr:transferring acyl groups [Brachionus plicatilis]